MNTLSFRITWKLKSNNTIQNGIEEKDINTYFACALIATISTVSKYYQIQYVNIY